MKVRIPFDDKHPLPLTISVQGKAYRVPRKEQEQDRGIVELPNELSQATVRHLLSMGYEVADDAASKKARESGASLDPEGQPLPFGGTNAKDRNRTKERALA